MARGPSRGPRGPPPAAAALACALLAILSLAAAQPGPNPLSQPASRGAPLSSVPGCEGASLAPNMDGCMLSASIERGQVHEYTFDVPARGAGVPFSVLLTAKSTGGLVEM